MTLRRLRKCLGFTLVEILMAMAIFGLVLTAIYATWTLILRSKSIGEAATAQVQRERIAVRVMEEALGSARSFAADVEHYGFVAENGEDGAISFVAKLPASFPRSGRFGDFDVRRVTFSIESGRNFGERELVLRQNPILMDVDEDEKNHPLVLAKGVRDMNFQFWDLRARDWVDDWDQTNQLPRLVKVTLRFGTSPSAQTRDEVTRIVALPSIAVPANWQRPMPQARAPVPGAAPVPEPIPPPATK